MFWQKGDRFEGSGRIGLWTVLDFDYPTQTVLGQHSSGEVKIFFFNEVEKAK